MKSLYLIVIICISSLIFAKLPDINIKEFSSLGESISFRGIFAISKEKAIISGSGGSLFYTENGGKIFKKLLISESSGLDFRDVHATDEKTFITLSVGGEGKSRIYKSSNAGKNWKMSYKNPYKNGFLNSINFWNKYRGIAVGDPVKGYFQILITTDGGDTWQDIDIKNIPPAEKGEAGFAASGTCVAVYGEKYAWLGTGGLKSRIFKSQDSGLSWKAYNTPILSSKNSTGIFSVYFSSPKHGIIVGGDYTIENQGGNIAALTSDGGVHWDLIKDKNLVFLSCVSVYRQLGEIYLIVTGPKGNFISKSGKSWKPFGKRGYHTLSVSPGKKTIWFAGSEGRVGRLILK